MISTRLRHINSTILAVFFTATIVATLLTLLTRISRQRDLFVKGRLFVVFIILLQSTLGLCHYTLFQQIHITIALKYVSLIQLLSTGAYLAIVALHSVRKPDLIKKLAYPAVVLLFIINTVVFVNAEVSENKDCHSHIWRRFTYTQLFISICFLFVAIGVSVRVSVMPTVRQYRTTKIKQMISLMVVYTLCSVAEIVYQYVNTENRECDQVFEDNDALNTALYVLFRVVRYIIPCNCVLVVFYGWLTGHPDETPRSRHPDIHRWHHSDSFTLEDPPLSNVSDSHSLNENLIE